MKYVVLTVALVFAGAASAKPGCWADPACKKQDAMPPLTEVKDRGYIWECRHDACDYE